MNKALAVFAKAPIPGYAKTRLAASIGDEAAASLYEKILSRFLCRISDARLAADRYLYVARPGDMEWFEEYRGDWKLRTQTHGNLGKRLRSVFGRLFGLGYEQVVIVGTDAPDLSPELVMQAFARLERFRLVLGPAHDGGYYLVGLNAQEDDIFRSINWGTASVLSQTLTCAIGLGLNHCLLPPLADIDTLQDWQRYLAANS
jgi:rSAM/selenodomain-associated transferase 1